MKMLPANTALQTFLRGRVPFQIFSSSSGFSLCVACFFLSSCTSISTTAATISLTPSSTSSQPLLAAEGIKCKNEQGKDVDSFIAYKLPKIRTSSNPLVRAGLAYVYILPSSSPPISPAASRVNGGSGYGADIFPAFQNTVLGHKHKGSFFGGHQHRHHHHHGRESYAGAGVGVGMSVTANQTSSATAATEESAAAFARTTSAWILSEIGIDSPRSMVGQTLGKLYEKDSGVAFVTYNDQPPVGPAVDTGGHSKGIIVTSLVSGFWIQHSVPHFPLLDRKNLRYQYPKTGRNNGQVFHCMSLPSHKDVDNLAKIFSIVKPHIVNGSFPTESLKRALPQLVAITNNHHQSQMQNDSSINRKDSRDVGVDIPIIKGGHNELAINKNDSNPCLNEVDERACKGEKLSQNKKQNWDLMEIRTGNGRVLKAFAKGPSFHEEIYSAWIAPVYKTKLAVQSWLNGPHPFTSNCTLAESSVFNILDKRIAGESFSTHNDHSKWAVSTNQPLVCISDLNRMEHQEQRGGVTLCFMDSPTWLTFNSSIIEIQPCPRLFGGANTTAETTTATTSATTTSTFAPLTGDINSERTSKGRSLLDVASTSSSSANKLDAPVISDSDDKKTSQPSHYRRRQPQLQRYLNNDHHLRHENQRRKVKSRTFSFLLSA